MNYLLDTLRLTAVAILFFLVTNCKDKIETSNFSSSFPEEINRVWIGPEYWANPLQDWQLNNGRIECIVSGGDRNVVLLTREIDGQNGEFNISLTFGRIGEAANKEKGWVGVKIGIQGEFSDYRDSAVRGVGFPIGLTNEGRLFIGKVDSTLLPIDVPILEGKLLLNGKVENNIAEIKLKLIDANNKTISELTKESIDIDWISGMIAIVCHAGEVLEEVNSERIFNPQPWGYKPGTGRHGNQLFWFDDLKLEGNIVKSYPNHDYGPILFSQHTLSKSKLKLTVQMPPIGDDDQQKVYFQTKKNNRWENYIRSND